VIEFDFHEAALRNVTRDDPETTKFATQVAALCTSRHLSWITTDRR
jgi:hypothetical protein